MIMMQQESAEYIHSEADKGYHDGLTVFNDRGIYKPPIAPAIIIPAKISNMRPLV
jgi:hypothetical protein